MEIRRRIKALYGQEIKQEENIGIMNDQAKSLDVIPCWN